MKDEYDFSQGKRGAMDSAFSDTLWHLRYGRGVPSLGFAALFLVRKLFHVERAKGQFHNPH